MVQSDDTPKKRTRKTTQKKSSAAKRTPAAGGGMSAAHKQALATGREEGRAVRQYLEALDAHKPKRGRKRTPESIERRLERVEDELLTADPLSRVLLAQEQIDLHAELENTAETVDLGALEDGFVNAAAGYSQRKGISYAAWRTVGIDADVLRRAGIPRTRS
jgi:hypothetical protein